MKQCWILVTRDADAKIISLYSPDFKCELINDNDRLESITDNYRSYALHSLAAHVRDKTHINTLKTLKELRDIPLTDLQHWECIRIASTKKYGFFKKALPIMGQLSNAIAILAGAFITFMALRIASSHSEQTKDATQSNVMSILGAVFGSIMAFIMYIFSGASKMLAGVGSQLDGSLSKIIKRNNNNDPASAPENKTRAGICSYQTVAKRLLTTGTVACVLGNTLITSISQYQETVLLTERYLDLYPHLSPKERESYYNLLWWLVVVTYVSTMASSGLAFQGGFAEQLLKKASDKLSRQKIEAVSDAKETHSEHNPLLINNNTYESDQLSEPSEIITSTQIYDETPKNSLTI